MSFEPIAVVGQGNVLPGASSPEALWELVRARRSAVTPTDISTWRLGRRADMTALGREIASRTAGYVRGFDPKVEPELAGLDPVFLHPLFAAREALRGARIEGPRPRGVVVLGNLSYPTTSLVDFAIEIWSGAERTVDPRNRFCSGLPSQLVAQAVGFGAGGFSVDAACASSLYAIKLACDKLHDGEVDVALAGGVNHADDLFLHLGFTALAALSPTGQSRPFHRSADGLVPAFGAAVVALKRLADAEAAGDAILGVIRGVGLSNDGRSRGLLVPSEAGQVRAMRAAYEASGLSPDDVSLVECHATGTPVGDAAEIRSLREVFASSSDLPLGSLKSNLGHLITASGAAALIKVLAAMKAGVRPATIGAEEPIDELRSGPLRVLQVEEEWPRGARGARLAAINNFGFGGNNAHLLVEEYVPAPRSVPARPARWRCEIAVVAQSVAVGDATTTARFEEALLSGRTVAAMPPIELEMAGAGASPVDLGETNGQQLLLLRAAQELRPTLDRLPRERTALLVGMQVDAEVARYGLRWRRADAEGGRATERPLSAAAVVGCMPNILANRLGQLVDFRAASFTVSADEASGNVALDLVVRELETGAIDAAVVGAVELGCEPVHAAAAESVLLPKPGDAAVLLVLKRLEDARRDGDAVLAVLGPDADVAPGARIQMGAGLTSKLGHAHAASGLLHVAAAITACARRALPSKEARPAMPWLPSVDGRHAVVDVRALGGTTTRTVFWPDERATTCGGARTPRLAVFGAADRAGLVRALEDRRADATGDEAMRVAIVAPSDEELEARIGRAAQLVRERLPDAKTATLAEGIFYGAGPLAGEVAFVFTGPAGAYSGMGGDLALALPELVDRCAARFRRIREVAGWIYDQPPSYRAAPIEKLWGSSYLIQLHAELTRGLLGMKPHAAIGYCSGETNALFALGAWDDLDGFERAVDASRIYSHELAGELRCVRRAWRVAEGEAIGWSTLRVLAPAAEVRAALEGETQAHLTIVNGPSDVVVAGEPAACARFAARLGERRIRPLDYDFVMHCPEARVFASEWRSLHRRPTSPVPGVRFYTHATCGSYEPSIDAVADALTGQAMNVVDFPRLVERAWADGVRVFIEHGPHAGCTKWIGETLGDKEHLAVALDAYGRSSSLQVTESVARLVAAGVRMDHRALTTRLEPRRKERAATPARSLPGTFAPHPPPVRFRPDDAEVMAPAPPLPSARLALEAHYLAPPAPENVEAPIASGSLQEQLTELHVAFLREQTAVHAEFLRFLFSSGAAERGSAPVPAPIEPPKAVLVTTPPSAIRRPTGPSFDRAQLETLASGRISSVFGPLFEEQDGYARQVRMPMPPLLLADRVTGIEGEPGKLGTGTIWTETDVRDDAWYLHEGRMPTGLLIESGQADLLLISWQGIDLTNRGERVYRLLGCDLTIHGSLPRPGETLRYEISIDGHAKDGDVRLFFFHYDCRVDGELRISVRGGQAGFFTDEELAASAGILWRPEAATPTKDGRVDPPAVLSKKRRFTSEDLAAFARGDAYACFGEGFARAASHTRTPAIQGGRMRLVDEVTSFDPAGGPWGRGYLAARLAITPDSWFFEGHFKNDPCMPGTLMFEGCVQAMTMYLAALGYTLPRDGWRFEPVTGQTYPLRCRGQVTPRSRELVYEVFVDEIVSGPEPTIWADLLCTVDGLKAFHCRRMGLRLVPSWPLEEGRMALPPAIDARPVAKHGDFAFGYRSLLACAWGRPSEAFGEIYRRFDGPRQVARLPGPPYHFMTRIARVTGEMGQMQVGSTVEVEYDVPRDAWYFAENGARVMPFCVLLEVALQPCGWLASYIGSALTSEKDLVFRNLDGTGTVRAEVPDDVSMLTTTARLESLSTAGGLIVVAFEVTVRAADTVVYTLKTVFGFFTPEMMVDQTGLSTTPEERARFLEPPERAYTIDHAARRPERLFGAPRIGRDKLRMVDRVTGFWPDGGEAKLGRIRVERDSVPSDWFFRAHFFQDPVQPGSLGIEVMLQALQLLMIELGMGEDGGRFEACALDVAMTWKYRGQVVPENACVAVDLELTARGRDERGPYAVASASLWVDGKRIYAAKGVGMRIVPSRGLVLDPAVDRWVGDHCPTYTRPALPMMSIADLLAQGALSDRKGAVVVAIEDLALADWLIVDRPRRLETASMPVDGDPERVRVTLEAEGRLVATATVRLAASYPQPPPSTLPPLAAPRVLESPYASGALFHGPAFHVLVSGEIGDGGARGILDPARGSVPRGAIAPVLLDGALHVVPHDALETWSRELASDHIGFPSRLESLELFGPAPEGEVSVEVRCEGPGRSARHAVLSLELSANGRLWARAKIVEVLLPRSGLGKASRLDRRAFLRDRTPVPGVRLSRLEAGVTRVGPTEIREADWLPGTVASVYGVDPSTSIQDLTRIVAVKEHVAPSLGVHPSAVDVDRHARALAIDHDERGAVAVRSVFDRAGTKAFWRRATGALGPWLGEDLFFALVDRFVDRIEVDDVAALRGRSAIYLANHEVAVETLLAAIVIGGLSETLPISPAKSEHRETWVGELIRRVVSRPGARDPGLLRFIEREDPTSVMRLRNDLTAELRAGKSLLVHVEGTRATSARARVATLSTVFLDLAVEADVPVVPLRFVGGLPDEPVATRLEFPVGYGRQDFFFGRPIAPDELRALPLADRKRRVLDAINALGTEPRHVPSPAFAAKVKARIDAASVAEPEAALFCALEELVDPSPESELMRGGRVPVDSPALRAWLDDLAAWLRGSGHR